MKRPIRIVLDFDWPDDSRMARLRGLTGVELVSPLPEGGYRVELSEESAAKPVLALLVQSDVTSIRTSRPSLEDVYMHIIGDRGCEGENGLTSSIRRIDDVEPKDRWSSL